MSKVLLLCPEPLGHRQPAGIGIRFLEFARALVADNHDVTVLSPDGGTVEGCRSEATTAQAIARLTRSSDVVVVQGHIANELFEHGSKLPTVVDLYDPFLIENLHYHATMGDQVFEHDLATLTRSLAEGDLYLCASEQQRLFYLGALTAAGRLTPSAFHEDATLGNLVRVVPFGVPPLRPPSSRDLTHPAVLFGGIYDWYDPILAIDAIAIARKRVPDLTLTFTRHPNAELTPQSKFAAAMRHATESGFTSFVRSEPWVPYQDRAAFYDRFSVALLTFAASIETDLAMRTRIFDYLWAGIPVVCSSAPGTDELLERYSAGVVIHSGRAEDYANALVEMLNNRDEYEKKVRGTQAYAADHQWPRLLEPLLNFCREPRMAGKRFSTGIGAGIPRRSFFARIKRRFSG